LLWLPAGQVETISASALAQLHGLHEIPFPKYPALQEHATVSSKLPIAQYFN
jgi:hypothetical protein